MTTIQKGDIALQRVILRAFELGYTVSKPCNEGSRYDLVVDDGLRLHRVQVKYCDYQPREGVFHLVLHKHSGGYRRRLYTYTDAEIDAVVAYLPAVGQCVWLPPALWRGRHQVSLRTHPARNGQTSGVNLADAYLW